MKRALIEYARLCGGGLEHGEDSESASDGGARAPGEKVRVRQEGVGRGAESAARDPTSRAGDSPPPCNFRPPHALLIANRAAPADVDNLLYDKSIVNTRNFFVMFYLMIHQTVYCKLKALFGI